MRYNSDCSSANPVKMYSVLYIRNNHHHMPIMHSCLDVRQKSTWQITNKMDEHCIEDGFCEIYDYLQLLSSFPYTDKNIIQTVWCAKYRYLYREYILQYYWQITCRLQIFSSGFLGECKNVLFNNTVIIK